MGRSGQKKQKRREVRENESLNGKMEEYRSIRKMDHGQLSKWENPPMDAFDYPAGKMERWVGKALKTWVKVDLRIYTPRVLTLGIWSKVV
jgi:hypothetical protein